MSYYSVELPYYTAAAYPSGGGYSSIRFTVSEDDGNGGLPGYPPDVLAGAIRDMLVNLPGVASTFLVKHTEEDTPL